MLETILLFLCLVNLYNVFVNRALRAEIERIKHLKRLYRLKMREKLETEEASEEEMLVKEILKGKKK